MTDHTVEELEKMLADAKAKEAHQEYPKHVEPHPSHVVTRHAPHGDVPPAISVPAFTSHHVDREGKVTVLVHDVEEEAKALAEKVYNFSTGTQHVDYVAESASKEVV